MANEDDTLEPLAHLREEQRARPYPRTCAEGNDPTLHNPSSFHQHERLIQTPRGAPPPVPPPERFIPDSDKPPLTYEEYRRYIAERFGYRDEASA